jgi:cellulose synthase/poly-beta-1,6-N-acetylglucosamine synthase-like glycosyltransferase
VSLEGFMEAFGIVAVAYFAALNGLYLVFTGVAWRSISRHLRRRRYDGADERFASPLTPGISILLPGFNEEAGIVASVRSLLRLRYPDFEIVVVSDGSTDGTLDRMREAFDLVPVRKVVRDALPTAGIRATYASRLHPALFVIDKANGGKADALNAGVNAATKPYVCAIDADAVIEEDALLRVAQPIIDDPERVIATGGIVRIANGCRIEDGAVAEVGLPKSRLATLQVVEYFRAFLVGRVGWSEMNALLIISGAFGVFQRDAVEAVGGWWTGTVGEDAELVVRLHRHMRERGEPYRIAFLPDPVCWTEAPEDLRTLSRQRRRWQRGLAQTLWRHRGAFGRPSHGAFGTIALPYFAIFELVGPVIEVVSYALLPVAVILGLLSPVYLVAFGVVALLLGLLLSVSALALEEFSFRRHPSGREVARMLLYAVDRQLRLSPAVRRMAADRPRRRAAPPHRLGRADAQGHRDAYSAPGPAAGLTPSGTSPSQPTSPPSAALLSTFSDSRPHFSRVALSSMPSSSRTKSLSRRSSSSTFMPLTSSEVSDALAWLIAQPWPENLRSATRLSASTEIVTFSSSPHSGLLSSYSRSGSRSRGGAGSNSWGACSARGSARGTGRPCVSLRRSGGPRRARRRAGRRRRAWSARRTTRGWCADAQALHQRLGAVVAGAHADATAARGSRRRRAGARSRARTRRARRGPRPRAGRTRSCRDVGEAVERVADDVDLVLAHGVPSRARGGSRPRRPGRPPRRSATCRPRTSRARRRSGSRRTTRG